MILETKQCSFRNILGNPANRGLTPLQISLTGCSKLAEPKSSHEPATLQPHQLHYSHTSISWDPREQMVPLQGLTLNSLGFIKPQAPFLQDGPAIRNCLTQQMETSHPHCSLAVIPVCKGSHQFSSKTWASMMESQGYSNTSGGFLQSQDTSPQPALQGTHGLAIFYSLSQFWRQAHNQAHPAHATTANAY